MSSDVIIVPRDVGRRAEGWIIGGGSGNITKGVELLLEENVFQDGVLTTAGPLHVDCSALFKRAIKILQDSPFEVLGLDLACGTIDVRKAYKKMALKYHPDKNPKTTPLFQIVQGAMSKLSITEEREKEIQTQQKKRTSFPPTGGKVPTPCAKPTATNVPPSFSAKQAPNGIPRPARDQAAHGGPAGSGPGVFHSSSYDSYSSKGSSSYSANPKPNPYGSAFPGGANANGNNPFTQANAQRQQQQPNVRSDEAKRKNYYEELLKEQYRKAAESDQRAREYAAKRAAEQKTEFDSFAKRAQQAYAQYQQNLHNFNAQGGAGSNHATPRSASDPPPNSFRPVPPNGATGSSGPPSARSESGSSRSDAYSKVPGNTNPGNGSGPPSARGAPSSASSGSSYNYNNAANGNGGLPTGVGRTYKATSDGRVFPQQQYVPPRASDGDTQTDGAAKGSAVPPLRPGGSAASVNNNSGNNKKLVPKPFAFRVNSVTATVVELEWKTSLLHYCNLGVELSWKERSASVWEVSEKMIRSGCCRKKNLTPSRSYDFRVRAVEDLTHNLAGGKSDWSDVLSVTIPAFATSASTAQAPQSTAAPTTRQSPPETKPTAPSKASISNPSKSSGAANAKPQESEPTKLSPNAPASIPPKFRRFNSKLKMGEEQEYRQMGLDGQHGSYGDVPRDEKDKKKEPSQDTAKAKGAGKNSAEKTASSKSKVFSSSAREAWSKDTQSDVEEEIKDLPKPSKTNSAKDKKVPVKQPIDSDYGEDVRYVEVEGDSEIEEDDDLQRRSESQTNNKQQDKFRADFYEEDATEDEAMQSQSRSPAKKTDSPKHHPRDNTKQSKPVSSSPDKKKQPGAGARMSSDHYSSDHDFAESDSTLGSFDKKLQKLDREHELAKKQHQFPQKLDSKKKEIPKQSTASTANKISGDKAHLKNSPFVISEDDDNYEGDSFSVEEEIHFRLVAASVSTTADGDSTTASSGGRKKGGVKSKTNVMEVMGHPVYCEPFTRSAVAGFLVADKLVIASAMCGDWVRVKIHILKDASAQNASQSAKKKATDSQQKKAVEQWGWCMLRDKTQTFLQPAVEGKHANPTQQKVTSSSTKSQTPVQQKPKDTDGRASPAHANEFKTPLKQKTLASKNSLGNTSLFNLNKPMPMTSKKAADADPGKMGKQMSDVESIDLDESADDDRGVEMWTECHDEQGNIYYYNEKTNQSSWDAPEWIEEVDAVSGAKYYCHFVYNGEEVSMTSTWTRPKRFARVFRDVPDI